jgi:hypothetical protein
MKIAAPLALFLTLGTVAHAREEATFTFRHDPDREGLLVQGADDGRFAFTRGKPLVTTLDSNAPGSRLLAPLPFQLDGATSFVIEVDLALDDVEASPDDFFQVSLGLVNAATTGLNRTGTSLPAPPFFVDDADCHDMVEIAYFPNVTSFGGPFLQPAVFGGDVGSPFANFAANFGSSSDLGDNGPGEITELPQGVPLRVRAVHDACAQRLVTRVYGRDGGREVELATGLLPVDLAFVNATATFVVDAFAVNAFSDLADFDPSTRSLSARLTLESARVTRLDGPAARLVPAARGGAGGGALLVVAEWAGALLASGADVPILVDSVDGVPVGVELSGRITGQGDVHAHVPRELLQGSVVTVRLGECLLDVEVGAP